MVNEAAVIPKGKVMAKILYASDSPGKKKKLKLPKVRPTAKILKRKRLSQRSGNAYADV